MVHSFTVKPLVLALALLGLCGLGMGDVILPAGSSTSGLNQQGSALVTVTALAQPHTPLEPGIHKQLVEVKFIEESQIRLREEELVTTGDDDLSELNELLARTQIVRIDRIFDEPEEELERERQQLKDLPGPPLLDLNLFYRIVLDSGADPDSFLDELLTIEIVEDAQFYSHPFNALVNTPDLTSSQGYRGPAPDGIDAKYAASVKGGKGSGITIIDLENGWNLSHEDLGTSISLISGQSSTDQEHIDHGTAVLGILAGLSNNYGITGIVPEAGVNVVSWNSGNTANFMKIAVNNLNAGDVMLLEGQIAGPKKSDDTGYCKAGDQSSCVPMEYQLSNYAAIVSAIKKGVVVVEAAGNGANDLDHPAYQDRFNRISSKYPDSGAIMVGAGYPAGGGGTNKPARARCSFSNYGSRLDLQGWGEDVATAGCSPTGCDLFDEGANRRYTKTFGGTSAASAMVAGAVAAVQGSWKAKEGSVLPPYCVRKVLVASGTVQAIDPLSSLPNNIGPLPNLKAAIDMDPGVLYALCGFAPIFHKPDLYWQPMVRIIIPDYWFEVSLWLTNGGPMPVERDYMIDFYLDDQLVHRQSGPLLASGEEVEVLFSHEVREGRHTVTIVADAHHQVDEVDEDNNVFTLSLDVSPEEADGSVLFNGGFEGSMPDN